MPEAAQEASPQRIRAGLHKIEIVSDAHRSAPTAPAAAWSIVLAADGHPRETARRLAVGCRTAGTLSIAARADSGPDGG
jgi:hypothetical protein